MSKDAENLNDWEVLERCRKGDEQAWRELVDRHQQSLRLSIRSGLRHEARYIQLVEDIEQDVWIALIEKDYKRLGLYDPEQGCFDTFLKSVAHQMVQRRRRRKCRRREREVRLGAHEPTDPTCNEGLVQAELAEYLENLTQREGRCLREKLLGIPSQESGPSISPGNLRYLRHRLQQKWKVHFDTR